jgi:hypothetical protein
VVRYSDCNSKGSGCESRVSDILTEDDIVNNINVLQSKIIAAYEKACPLKRARLNQSTPYWSSDLARLCKVARRAWNNCSFNPEAYRKDAYRL